VGTLLDDPGQAAARDDDPDGAFRVNSSMPLKAAAVPEAALSLRFAAVRARSLSLAAPLSAEDAMVQVAV